MPSVQDSTSETADLLPLNQEYIHAVNGERSCRCACRHACAYGTVILRPSASLSTFSIPAYRSSSRLNLES